MKKKNLFSTVVVSVISLFFILGCGGSGSGSGSGGGGGGSTELHTSTGSLALFLTDGPSDSFSKIMVNVTEVSLIPEDGGDHVVIFKGDYKFNLLELRDDNMLFTLNRKVPAGRYEKIRLTVSGITGEDGPCETLRLPSKKIDLNPRGTFEIKAGEILSIRLDIDANKSIHIAGPHCNFRPVVFVDIDTEMPRWRCPRILSGTVTEIIEEEKEGGGSEVTGFTMSLPGGRGDLEVSLSGKTVVFDDHGENALPGILKVDQKVKVRGRLNREGRLEASMVVIGDVFIINGIAKGPVDEDGIFSFEADPGESAFGEGSVLVQEETLLVAGCDQEVGSETIQEGVKCRVVGKLDFNDNEVPIRSVAIFLAPSELSGEIVSVEKVEHGSVITVKPVAEEAEDIAVFLPETSLILVEGDGSIPVDFLCAGQKVTVSFDLDNKYAPGYPQTLLASGLHVYPEQVKGMVTEIDGPARVLVLESGERIYAWDAATILDLRGESSTPADFSDIGINDYVEIFGLAPCEGETEGRGLTILLEETPEEAPL